MKQKKYIVTLLFALTIYFLLSEMFRQILLYREFGYFNWWYFPFQLCSMPLYDLPIYLYLLRKKNEHRKIFSTFMMAYGALGGTIVFLDTSGLHFRDPILTCNSYLWHVMMVVLSLLLFLYEDIDDSWKGYGNVCLLYLCHALIATILNIACHRFGSLNMFYISPYEKMYQIVFKEIGEATSNRSAIILYLIASLLGAGIVMYLYRLLRKRIKGEENAETV